MARVSVEGTGNGKSVGGSVLGAIDDPAICVPLFRTTALRFSTDLFYG